MTIGERVVVVGFTLILFVLAAYCACHHRSHNDRRHAHHVAQLVEDMLTADARLANRFQK